eukprot:403339304
MIQDQDFMDFQNQVKQLKFNYVEEVMFDFRQIKSYKDINFTGLFCDFKIFDPMSPAPNKLTFKDLPIHQEELLKFSTLLESTKILRLRLNLVEIPRYQHFEEMITLLNPQYIKEIRLKSMIIRDNLALKPLNRLFEVYNINNGRQECNVQLWFKDDKNVRQKMKVLSRYLYDVSLDLCSSKYTQRNGSSSVDYKNLFEESQVQQKQKLSRLKILRFPKNLKFIYQNFADVVNVARKSLTDIYFQDLKAEEPKGLYKLKHFYINIEEIQPTLFDRMLAKRQRKIETFVIEPLNSNSKKNQTSMSQEQYNYSPSYSRIIEILTKIDADRLLHLDLINFGPF